MQVLIIIATVLSVTLSVIRVIDFIKEKYNVKVRVTGSNYVYDGKTVSEKKTHITISIINNGKEPVTIINAGLLGTELKKDCNFFSALVFKEKSYKLLNLLNINALKVKSKNISTLVIKNM